MLHKSHAGLSSYLTRNKLNAERDEDGAIVLVFDRQYRVCFQPAQHGDLVLESRLMDLPDDVAHCDALLLEALQNAQFRIPANAETLVLSEDERILFLQQRISVDAATDVFESELEQFINAISVWRQYLRIL